MIEIFHGKEKIADINQDEDNILLTYNNQEPKHSIALSLPNTQKIHYFQGRFVPFLETFLPEGYLYELFKNILTKQYGYIDDYLMFSFLANNIDERISFKSNFQKESFPEIDLEEIIDNDTPDTFNRILKMFLSKNAIGGVQPKTVVLTKESLRLKEYIVKTWGSEFPYLAENEYICMEILKKAKIKTANVILSKNKRFLIVEKFTDKTLGFEEVLSLLDKNRIFKYQASYEQIAKTVYEYVNNPLKDLETLFRLIAMNYYLKNGDAHLKNFGILFNDDFSNIFFAPAYDVVNTVVYIFKDKPALTLNGRKIWVKDKELIDFGKKYCMLNDKDVLTILDECKSAINWGIDFIKDYVFENPHFKKIGNRMIDVFRLAFENKTGKVMDDAFLRNWQ